MHQHLSWLDEHVMYRQFLDGKVKEQEADWVACGKKGGRWAPPKWTSAQVQDMIARKNSDPTGKERTTKYLAHGTLIVGPPDVKGGIVGTPVATEELKVYQALFEPLKKGFVDSAHARRAAEMLVKPLLQPLTAREIFEENSTLDDMFGKKTLGRNEFARLLCYLPAHKRKEAFLILTAARNANNPKPPKKKTHYSLEEAMAIVGCMLGQAKFSAEWKRRHETHIRNE